VVKTRVQSAIEGEVEGETRALLGREGRTKRVSTWGVAVETYRVGGLRVFFRGLGVCSLRAFIVNAVQFAVYEYLMELLMKEEKSKIPAVVEMS